MINLVFPNKCKICSGFLESDFLCNNCKIKLRLNLKLKFIDPKNNLDGLFYLCDLNYELRKILHLGKYRFSKNVWKFLGEVLNDEFKNMDLTVSYVPMNWIRYCYRGFNQSYLLAKNINKPVKLVSKNWMVHSVTNLNKKARSKELENAFISKNNSHKNIVIVDDVYTTGATLNQIAKTIKANDSGVKIYGLVVAKTPLKWRGT